MKCTRCRNRAYRVGPYWICRVLWCGLLVVKGETDAAA